MNILITGGASGLGEAITRRLAKDNNNIIYFTYSKSLDKAKKLESECINTHSIKCDFEEIEDLSSLMSKLPQLDLDVLVNNAYTGDYLKTYFHKIAPEEFVKDFNSNIIPIVKITQSVISGFRKKKCGKIITVLTSALIDTPPIGSSVYVANKAYLEELTKVWANENAKFGISSNSVSPSFMQTNLTSSTDERVIEQVIENHPLKKILTVEEVADTVYFLVNASPHINGVNIIMNAGMHII